MERSKIGLPILILLVVIALYFAYTYGIVEEKEEEEEKVQIEEVEPVPDIIVAKKGAQAQVIENSTQRVLYEGDDTSAIRAAVRAIDQGTILVNEGTYTITSPIVVGSNIRLVGDNSILKGHRIFRIYDAENVRVTGFKFAGPDEEYIRHTGSYGLLQIANTKNCLIEDNTFTAFSNYGVYLSTRSTSDYNQEITVRDNQFLDFGYCGVMIGKQASSIFVEDNIFKNINTLKLNTNSYGTAVAKGNNAYKYSEYIYIRNNTVENNPMWEGIDSHGSNHLYIENNRIIDCRIPISVSHITEDNIYAESLHDVSITGNYIDGNLDAAKQDSGIYVIGGRNGASTPYINITLKDNTITEVNNWLFGDDGAIVLQNVDEVLVYNNTISKVGGTGINLENANNVLVQKNDIKDLVTISEPRSAISVSHVTKDYAIEIEDNAVDLSAECVIHFDASPDISEKELCIDLSDFSLSDVGESSENIFI
ncbi:right-handed parallel beta-helix repeat-containing protein [Methanolobus sp. ZRKC2]|uniref:right-handed parallel beta-helix repeat-containing protein n=1 Tax=Methanolobus sp. ZRKC2 TaxID=3125783 RepID=UPI003247F129